MRSEGYRTSFSSIAKYYDTLMSFVNYPGWIEYIEEILKQNGSRKKTIFDLACGTGVCLELWSEKGYQTIGLDQSFAMLRVCRDRFRNVTGTAPLLINGDMRSFAIARNVPIVTCLYDSLNYLTSEEELVRCFRNVYDVIERGGIFIFDMNTVRCLRDEWGNGTFNRQDDNIHSVWSNSYDYDTGISTLRLTLTVYNNGTASTMHEMHRERGYPLITIAQHLSEVGFEFTLYRHLTFQPAHEQNMRIMGVARK
jgi:ubiquinone/menaquinone biosynthesis C-methylase UbiE